MGRTPKTKVNMKLLDSHIKEKEGSAFDYSKISKFIMGKGDAYYRVALRSECMANDVLDRVCEYYGFNKQDYIITEETKKKEVQKEADTLNYENVILLLTGIDKTLKELLGQQKSTNYLINELRTDLAKDNKINKEILGKLETVEKRSKKYDSSHPSYKVL